MSLHLLLKWNRKGGGGCLEGQRQVIVKEAAGKQMWKLAQVEMCGLHINWGYVHRGNGQTDGGTKTDVLLAHLWFISPQKITEGGKTVPAGSASETPNSDCSSLWAALVFLGPWRNNSMEISAKTWVLHLYSKNQLTTTTTTSGCGAEGNVGCSGWRQAIWTSTVGTYEKYTNWGRINAFVKQAGLCNVPWSSTYNQFCATAAVDWGGGGGETGGEQGTVRFNYSTEPLRGLKTSLEFSTSTQPKYMSLRSKGL